MDDTANNTELIQEELITHPARLIAVIEACEVMGFGWWCEKEVVELRGEDGKVAEEAIHFRFRSFKAPKVVPPETIGEFD